MSLRKVSIEEELHLIHCLFVEVRFFNPYPIDIGDSSIRKHTFLSPIGGYETHWSRAAIQNNQLERR